MLTEKETQELSQRLEKLACTNPNEGNGLFTFVLSGEPQQEAAVYQQHIAECEYCRVALELYRYKRDASKLFAKWETARKIVASAHMPQSRILKKRHADRTAYFEPNESDQYGTTVVVGSKGEFISVSSQTRDEFMRLNEF